jgi:hypothetical protein
MVPLRIFVLALLVAAGSSGQAQDAGTPAPRIIDFSNEDGITTSFVQPQNIGSTEGGSGGSGTEQQWLKVEFHYSVNPDKTPFVDAAEFKVWIEGRDLYAANAPGNQGVAICLTGSVTYINLAKTRDAYGVFFVHPSTLARYCGTGTFEDFDRKFNIHIDALVDGKLVDYYDKNKHDAKDWWTLPPAVPNLVYRQCDSPFLLADVNHYPEMKLDVKQAQ